ncbi:Phage tail length tape-measure protein [Candidatus Arthromitus sp. SFB-mouse-NL]|uniref:phage tail tape measure protein n=1 Tax=Candidatus Arthromitus sp. SFB-mouse-NL TaxID=1508644 RepID=UPI000499F6F6|nr:phage tail tape measure protein [Candidatus Arthromitus sp. SFB-mouse-NL]AID44731.1 Phage tail length tape-measure protein [Candidatus Arthromitus sp. SFB-mouse-NL]
MKYLNAIITLKDAFTSTLSKIKKEQTEFISNAKGVSGVLSNAYKLDDKNITSAINSINDAINKNKEKLKETQTTMNKWKELLSNSTPVVKSLSKEVQDLSLKKQRLIKEMDKVKESSDTNALSKYEYALDDINKTLKEKTTTLNKAKSEQNKYAKELRESEKEVSKLDVSIGALSKKLKEISSVSNNKKIINLEGASDNINSFYDKSKNEKDKYSGFNKLGDSVKGIGKGLTAGITAPVSLGIGASLKVGVEFESQMSSVEATLGDKASIENMQLLKDKARDMGASTTKSATESAQAMEYMALAGWDTTQIIGGIEPILRLSEASKADLATTSDLVTDSMSALGIEVNELEGFLDKVAKTSTSANTSVIELMEAFITSGGKANSLGIDLSELSSVLGVMASRGYKGAQAGRGLSALLTNLTSPIGQAKEALEELNFSAFDSQGNFIGLGRTLYKLENALKGMTQEQRVTYLSMIAGKEHGTELNGILDGLAKEYEGLTGDIRNSDGALNDMALTMQNNASGGLSGLKSKLEDVGIGISEILLPYLKKGIEIVGGLVDKFRSLSPETQSNIVKFGLLAAVIPPLIIVGGALISSVGSIVSGFKMVSTLIGNLPGLIGGLSKAINLLGGAFSFLAANPVVVIVGALVGIVLVIMHLWQTNENFRDAVHNIWQSIVEKVEWATNKIIDGVNWVIDKLNAIPMVNIKTIGHVEWSDKSKQQRLDNFKASGNALGVSRDNPLAAPGYNTPLINGSHKTGLSYVPYDGYIAQLHKGERVLTEQENKLYNSLYFRDRLEPVKSNNRIVNMVNSGGSRTTTTTNNTTSNNSSNITINVNANVGSNNNIDINNMANQVANIIANKIRMAKINVI